MGLFGSILRGIMGPLRGIANIARGKIKKGLGAFGDRGKILAPVLGATGVGLPLAGPSGLEAVGSQVGVRGRMCSRVPLVAQLVVLPTLQPTRRLPVVARSVVSEGSSQVVVEVLDQVTDQGKTPFLLGLPNGSGPRAAQGKH